MVAGGMYCSVWPGRVGERRCAALKRQQRKGLNHRSPPRTPIERLTHTRSQEGYLCEGKYIAVV